MDREHRQITRLDGLIWSAIGTIAMADIAFVAIGQFTIAWRSFLPAVLVCTALTLGALFYRVVRPDDRLTAALTGTAHLVGFAAVGAPLSYIAASANLPLWDATFAAWDRHVAFDWTAWLELITTIPWLHAVLETAYASFSVQAITTLLLLSLMGQIVRLKIFVAAFVATTLAVIAISTVCPAAGTWIHYGIDATAAHGYSAASQASWPVFFGLRDGTVNTLTGINSQGIITFPSLHAALAVLFIIALWQVPGLRWIALALNLAMIAATPIEGSHYLVDVIAGLVIAACSWRITSRFCAAAVHSDLPLIPITDVPSMMPDEPDGPALQAVTSLPIADRADVT